MTDFELYHYGVKGMKWGVRRKSKTSSNTSSNASSLTDKQIKKYARKGYAQDSFRSNETVQGKVWDAYTGAHRMMGNIKYDTSSKKQNRERAEKYLADKKASRTVARKKAVKTVAKGSEAAVKATAKIGQMYITDQVFFGGIGTRAAKSAVKTMGRAVLTANAKAHGAWDIRWYD